MACRSAAINGSRHGLNSSFGNSIELPANDLASQADDVRAHRQQNGDADGNDDQEEFSHRWPFADLNAVRQQ